MVSLKSVEGDNLLVKQNCEPSKVHPLPYKGKSSTRFPFYHYQIDDQHFKDDISYDGLLYPSEESSFLDSLLLAQWEDCAWSGLLRYDITSCETKIIHGTIRFIAQLNENYKKSPNLRNERILFCVTSGEKMISELTSSSLVPNNGVLIISNENPVEYGHVFVLPSSPSDLQEIWNAKSLEMVMKITVDVDNCSFRVFCDCFPTSSADSLYFQACYFSHPLPVELMSLTHLTGDWLAGGLRIYEVANYPIRTLVFTVKGNLKFLMQMISEIGSSLQNQFIPFSLLLSSSGRKVFLFPQAPATSVSCNLSVWECAGYFIFKTKHDFASTCEESLLKHLSAVSLEPEAFNQVKQLCFNIATKLTA